jgi:hypothetical protein
MIGKIIELSVKNKFLVILATLFVIAAGIYAIVRTPLDAIPDLSDVQVIIFTEYPGQAPQVVEDQVTYPLTTAMLSVPFAKVVRGISFFGISFVYIIFEDGTDLYWARSRVLEYLNFVAGRLPAGRDALPGSRCHRRRLGIRIHPRERPPRPGAAAFHPGLVSALRTGQRSRVSPRWPPSADMSNSTRWSWTPTSCGPTTSPSRRSAWPSSAATRMSAAGWWKWARPNSWCGGWGISRASTTFIPCR